MLSLYCKHSTVISKCSFKQLNVSFKQIFWLPIFLIILATPMVSPTRRSDKRLQGHKCVVFLAETARVVCSLSVMQSHSEPRYVSNAINSGYQINLMKFPSNHLAHQQDFDDFSSWTSCKEKAVGWVGIPASCSGVIRLKSWPGGFLWLSWIPVLCLEHVSSASALFADINVNGFVRVSIHLCSPQTTIPSGSGIETVLNTQGFAVRLPTHGTTYPQGWFRQSKCNYRYDATNLEKTASFEIPSNLLFINHFVIQRYVLSYIDCIVKWTVNNRISHPHSVLL
jgi:hypothetical protein